MNDNFTASQCLNIGIQQFGSAGLAVSSDTGYSAVVNRMAAPTIKNLFFIVAISF